MTHYKIRSTKESLERIFEKHLDHICFSIKNENEVSGICDVLVIPENYEVEKIIQNHFIHIKIGCDDMEYNE